MGPSQWGEVGVIFTGVFEMGFTGRAGLGGALDREVETRFSQRGEDVVLTGARFLSDSFTWGKYVVLLHIGFLS